MEDVRLDRTPASHWLLYALEAGEDSARDIPDGATRHFIGVCVLTSPLTTSQLSQPRDLSSSVITLVNTTLACKGKRSRQFTFVFMRLNSLKR